MYVIDHQEICLPKLNKAMLDIDKGLYEYNLIHVPFTNEATQSKEFDGLQDLLIEVLHSNYYNPWNEIESEFEESIDKKLYFNMMLNPKTGDYDFTVSTFADNGEVMAEVKIGLTDTEYQMCLEIANSYQLIAC